MFFKGQNIKKSSRTLYCKSHFFFIIWYEAFWLDRNSQDQVMPLKFLPEEKFHLIKLKREISPKRYLGNKVYITRTR